MPNWNQRSPNLEFAYNRQYQEQLEKKKNLERLIYLYKHHYPKMSISDIWNNASRMMEDKEWGEALFNKHWSINQLNMKQRRGLGIPESDKDYVYDIDSKQPGYLEKLWNPKPETWM